MSDKYYVHMLAQILSQPEQAAIQGYKQEQEVGCSIMKKPGGYYKNRRVESEK